MSPKTLVVLRISTYAEGTSYATSNDSEGRRMSRSAVPAEYCELTDSLKTSEYAKPIALAGPCA